MSFQNVINGRLGLGIAGAIARTLPPRVGWRLGSGLAKVIAGRRNLAMVQAVRANQWVLSGGTATAVELDQAVQGTFRYAARFIYDTHRYRDDPEAIDRLIDLGPDFHRVVRTGDDGQRGLVVVMCHMGAFDLSVRAAVARGFEGFGLAMPRPGGGYQKQNEFRRQAGIAAIPISRESIGDAIQHLRAGGVVVTGADRPLPDAVHRPAFLGRPASLPVHYVSLAMKADVPIVAIAYLLEPDGYHFYVSEEIEIVPGKDRRATLANNAERVLSVIGDYIRRAPQQWMMFYPVWPEALDEVP